MNYNQLLWSSGGGGGGGARGGGGEELMIQFRGEDNPRQFLCPVPKKRVSVRNLEHFDLKRGERPKEDEAERQNSCDNRLGNCPNFHISNRKICLMAAGRF